MANNERSEISEADPITTVELMVNFSIHNYTH